MLGNWRRIGWILLFFTSILFSLILHAVLIPFGGNQASAEFQKAPTGIAFTIPNPKSKTPNHTLAVDTSSIASPTGGQLVQQGIAAYQAGKFSEAIALWERALPQIEAPQDRAIVCSNLALAYRQIGKLDRAIAQWEQAIQIYRSQGDKAMRQPLAGLLTEQAQAYSDLGQQRRAIPLLEEAIKIARANQEQPTNRATLVAAWGASGNAYWSLGNYDRALTAHQTSLKIARQLNDANYIATALNNLGNVYASRAARYSYQANSAQLEGDDREAERLNQAASQDLVEARKLFEESVQAARGAAGLEEVRALMNLNRLLVAGSGKDSPQSPIPNLSEQDLIVRNWHRAKELLELAPDSRDKAYALINLAQQQLQLEERLQVSKLNVESDAPNVTNASLSENNLQPPTFNLQPSTFNLQPSNLQPSNLQPSTLLEQALSVARTIGDARAESFALGGLGQLNEKAGDLTRAMELTRAAQFAAQQVNAPDSLYRWQWQAGRILKATGDREKAIAAYEQAIASLQSIRGDIVAANKELQLDFRQQVEPVYRELMALLLQSEAVKSQKSTSEVDSKLRRGINSTANSESPLKRTQTTSSVHFSGLKLSARKFISGQDTEFNPKSKIQNPKSTAVQKVIDTLELLKLAELQNFFGDECVQIALSRSEGEAGLTLADTVVVYSVILNDRTEMILRSPDGTMTNYPVAMSQQEIQTEIDQLRYFLELQATEEYLPLAQNVYNLLIRPMEADLAALKPNILVFINDGVLRKVPMAALHDGKEFLVQKYQLATTPSLSLTVREPIDRTNLEALSLGLTVGRSQFPPLTNVQAEVKAVNEILGGSELIDEQFTLSNLQKQFQQQSYPIVHIATHGKFGVDAESTFLVGYDQRISIEQLDNLLRSQRNRQPVELLTLSACQTAAGDDRSALGIAGVAVRAGVESALATLWYINDEATVPLIEEFYRQLRQSNISKAEALREAQLKMIADVNYNHPAVWSPFILIGNWL